MKLPRLHDAQPWIVFSFKYTLDDIKGFQLVSISVPFWKLVVELYTQDLAKFLRRRFVSRCYFQDGGTGTSFGGRSFTHCFVKRVGRLRMFIHNDRVELLYCFV